MHVYVDRYVFIFIHVYACVHICVCIFDYGYMNKGRRMRNIDKMWESVGDEGSWKARKKPL